MRFPVSCFASIAAAALIACAATTTFSQSSSSSSSSTVQTQTQQPAPAPEYVPVDPLAGVRYDNRWDISLGAAYAHIKAGPNLLQGANLGGVNLSGSYWFAKRWGAEGTFRPTVGTSGAAPNTQNIDGPFVAQYMFAAGPQWLGPHNKHASLIAHALIGGAYGDFERDLRGNPPNVVGFYPNQVAPAGIFGGHIDLNRSPRWVFRVTTDALWTRYSTYGIPGSPSFGRNNWNYGMSVGMMYRFKGKR